MRKTLDNDDWDRYARQMALPDITPAHQERLKNTRLVMVGAGGLGAPALPYLAAAGVGDITIIDHDAVDRSNLHRQTIYKDAHAGRNKAALAAAYLRELNPAIKVRAVETKLEKNDLPPCDLILDGSDNFKTKDLLNEISIETGTPLISASVNRFEGQIGVFSGAYASAPCYRCLHPDLPDQARNCNQAGILGTSAGITGLYQAHFALCYSLGIGDIREGAVLALDLKSMRGRLLTLPADPDCAICSQRKTRILKEKFMKEIPLVARTDLKENHVVIDVREDHELVADPIRNVIHIPLGQLPGRVSELPRDKTIALVCASNIRSRKGAEYLASLGFEDVCVLDKKTA